MFYVQWVLELDICIFQAEALAEKNERDLRIQNEQDEKRVRFSI